MAELFMECEEEELEPWQQRVKEVEEDDDDDDEPIFVGEISSSKPANILNRVNSSRTGIQNGAPSRGTVTTFKPTGQHFASSESNPGPMAVSPAFQSLSRTTPSSAVVQPLTRPVNVSGTSQTLQRPIPGLEILSIKHIPESVQDWDFIQMLLLFRNYRNIVKTSY
uniref:DUF4195 domain-containing protein n=1 Tax=Sphenodon punctatus TaxID=8508 RepID=A0A8D0HNY9_SPHPU